MCAGGHFSADTGKPGRLDRAASRSELAGVLRRGASLVVAAPAADMERLARLARPTYSGGRWHKARVSAKNLARHRKQALLAGEEWELERPRNPMHINPLAGRKRVLQRPERQAEIQARLDRMPEIIEEYRQYLIQSKTDAYDKRELHVYFDADQVRPSARTKLSSV